MEAEFEFHDSDCCAIEVDDIGNALVVMDAYVHRDPAANPHTGGYQRIHITMTEATIRGDRGLLPAEIYEGSLVSEGLPRDCIPLPSQSRSESTLNLMLAKDARVIEIVGKGVTITPEGPFRFLEMVPFGWNKNES